MSQSEVLKLLSKNKEKWLTVKQIANKLDVGISGTNKNLRKLMDQKEIKRMKFKKEQNEFRTKNGYPPYGYRIKII